MSIISSGELTTLPFTVLTASIILYTGTALPAVVQGYLLAERADQIHSAIRSANDFSLSEQEEMEGKKHFYEVCSAASYAYVIISSIALCALFLPLTK